MRIAIIGNMNNNGFAMMRYFRDLGADAWLLPFATDGTGSLDHFAPQADTWQLTKWQRFISPLPVPNTTAAIIGQPPRFQPPPSKTRIREALAGYDAFIGSGVAPALFERIGRRLDIFCPYSVGIEFYGTVEFRARMAASRIRRLLHMRVRRMQARGIRSASHCLNAELSLTRQSFDEIGKPFERIGMPMVYNRDPSDCADPSSRLRQVLGRMSSADVAMFGAARQMWTRPSHIPQEEWSSRTKNSDWLIRGLAEFTRNRPHAKPLLAIVEYGPDVDATKRLVGELGVGDYVQWLPIMPRREIMLLLQACDIGVGEFYTDAGLLWGGTGWEALAAGRPLLQAFNFTDEGYQAEFGHRPPEVLDARSPSEVAWQMARIADLEDKGRAIGRASLQWFEEHGGIGLARRWLEVLDRGERVGI